MEHSIRITPQCSNHKEIILPVCVPRAGRKHWRARLYWCANHSEPEGMPDKSPREITAEVLVPDSWFQLLLPKSRATACAPIPIDVTFTTAWHSDSPSSSPRLFGSSTVSPWCNLRGHCPSTRPGNSEVLDSRTSGQHDAAPRPSTMPHLASAWNVHISFVANSHCGRSCDRDASLIAADLYVVRRFSSNAPRGSAKRIPGDASDRLLLSKPKLLTAKLRLNHLV